MKTPVRLMRPTMPPDDHKVQFRFVAANVSFADA
jgi:hypothetical protein